MERLLITTLALLALTLTGTAVMAQTRTIILNTGYDQANSTRLAVGQQDNEWRVVSDTVNGAPQPPPATGRPADVVSDDGWNANPLLAINFPNSRWISINPNQGKPLPFPLPRNKFQYAFYFTLPLGFASPVLTMKLSADDRITKVTLNSATLFQGSGGIFNGPPLPISLLTASDFNSGALVNVITVEVEDTGAIITGLIVDGTVTYEDCNRLPIREIPDLTSITFWESTVAAPTQHTFLKNGPQLTAKLNGSLSSSNKDFEGVTGAEFYDVFYSDWDGTPNLTGQFVTIEAEWNLGAPSGGGLNLARVDFNGTGKFADSVASFVALGNNAMPNDVGKAVDLDPGVLTDTTMGNTTGQTQRLRVTVGFRCRPPCAQPPSITLNPAAGVLPPTVINVFYMQTFTATGGCAASVTYSLTSGVLPIGLTFGPNGVLSGTATQSGDFTFTVTATDSCGCSKSETYALKVRPTGTLIVTKTVKNLPAPSSLASTNFPIGVSCLPSGPSATFNLAPGGTHTVNDIRAGSTCTVFEGTLPALLPRPDCVSVEWGTPTYAPGQTVTIPSTGGSQEVLVTNTYFCNKGPACARLPSQMVSWWPLNEPAGATVVTDIKGGHNGVPMPAGSLAPINAQPGKVGGSLFVTGNFNVSVPDDQALKFGTTNFTVDAWFASAQPQLIGAIVDKLDIDAKKGYAFYIENDHLKFVMGDGKAFTTYTSAASVGITSTGVTWHHVAVTVYRKHVFGAFYIDGTNAGQFQPPDDSIDIATNSPLLIGASRLSFLSCVCDYKLDEVEIFNNFKLLFDIQGIYDLGSAGKCTASVKGKKFNDLNQSAVLDAGEQGLSGWTIRVTDQDGTTHSTTTDAQGNYSFTVPAPGTFTLSEVNQASWSPTTSTQTTITLAANESAEVNFGNIKAGKAGFTLQRGMNEFCIWGGGGSYNSQTPIDNPNSAVLFRNTGGVRFGTIGLCYGRILSANSRFAFKYTFNAIPVAVLSYPDVNRDLGIPVPGSETRRNVYGAGLSPIGFQLYFRPQSRIKPFVNTSGGFIFFKHQVPQLNGARFNFTYDLGGGVQVFRDSRRAFNFGYKYQHFSTGGHALNNPGFDGHVFYFGYSIFSSPKIAPSGNWK